MNFFEHQERARRKSLWLVGQLIVAIVVIIVLVNFAIYFGLCFSQLTCYQLTDYFQSTTALVTTAAITLIISITSLFRSWQLRKQGGLKAVLMAGATPINYQSPSREETQLINVVEEMAIASGMPAPQLFIMRDEPGINAFVAGTHPDNTFLAVTQGTLDHLSRQELQGVVAHEFSHIFNGDMRFNIHLIGVLAGILVIGQLGEFLTRSQSGSRISGRGRSNGAQLALIGLGIMLVGYIGLFFGRLIKAGISRQREYLADASAVQFTRDKSGITNALYKIQNNYQGSYLASASSEELSHMCFERSHRIKLLSSWLSTHPPIDKRIHTIDPQFVPPNTTDNRQQTADNTDEPSANEKEIFTTSIAAGLLTKQVGSLTMTQLNRTQMQLNQLPENLKHIVRGNHKHYYPHQYIYTLLFIFNTLTRAELFALCSTWLKESDLEAVSQLLADVSPLDLEAQFLLLDLALPRIRNYESSLQKTILLNCKKLADSDKKVSIPEYIIYSLVFKHCQSQQPRQAKIHSYQQAQQPITVLLQTFIHQTTLTTQEKQEKFRSLMDSMGLQANFQKNQIFNAIQFHNSLHQLAYLNPILKKTLIDSLADSMTSDGMIHTNEFMLIRGVCEYLDCPLPKLI